MDNLTHSLTGLMLSRAGLHRLTPRAGVLLMLAANMPDVDVVSWLGGRARYLDIHRGYTHSWALLPLVALLPVVLVRLWPGGAGWSWWKAWVASMVGVASHLLLDWTNTYGVRFGMPFEASWHRLDVLFIVDPWIWMMLLFGVAAPFLSRLVSSEIGAKRTSGGGMAWFALVMITAYIGLRAMLHGQAIALLNSRVYENQNPRRVAVMPAFGSPWRWRAIAELPDGYWVLPEMNLLRDFDPAVPSGDARVFYQASDVEAMDKARGTDDFQAFLRFNQYPLWRVIPMPGPEGAVKVELFDMRFGDPAAPGFVATAVVEGGRSASESLQFGTPRI